MKQPTLLIDNISLLYTRFKEKKANIEKLIVIKLMYVYAWYKWFFNDIILTDCFCQFIYWLEKFGSDTMYWSGGVKKKPVKVATSKRKLFVRLICFLTRYPFCWTKQSIKNIFATKLQKVIRNTSNDCILKVSITFDNSYKQSSFE